MTNFIRNRFIIPKHVEERTTCSDDTVQSVTTDNTDNGAEAEAQPPPQKKKRLSNREYKKLKKGQNKVGFAKSPNLI